MTSVPWALALVPLTALFAAAPDGPTAYEIAVGDVAGGPDACPSQDQVGEALAARMPGVVAHPGRPPGPLLLHLELAVTRDGVTRVTMTDATGALRLERDLEVPRNESPSAATGHAPAREHGGACAALADTVALIIERYMRHIGYHEPPPPALVEPTAEIIRAPPTPQPARNPSRCVGAGSSVRAPRHSAWRIEPELTAALAIGRLELGLSLGLTLPIEQPIPMASAAGTFTWSAVPAHLTIGGAWVVAPRVAVVPMVGAGVDVVIARTRGIGQSRRSTALEPTVEAGLLVRLSLTRRVWLALHAFQGLDVRPEEFYVTTGVPAESVTLFATPRTYMRMGLDFGAFLGKN